MTNFRKTTGSDSDSVEWHNIRNERYLYVRGHAFIPENYSFLSLGTRPDKLCCTPKGGITGYNILP